MDKSSLHGPRRIQLFSSVPLENSKKSEKPISSIRLTIKLAESSDSCCPEYSYVELLGKLKDSKESSNDCPKTNLNALDPFALEDEKEIERMEKIAQDFNEKYGSSKKTKRKRNIRDLVDLGEGYTEDSFVDNSEAYDEVVPWSLDTKYGGFYINTGTLDFVKGDDEDDDYGYDNDDDFEEDEIMPVRKKKKMLLSSDNEEPIVKKGLECDDGKKKKKRKKLEKMKIASELNQEKRTFINGKHSLVDDVGSCVRTTTMESNDLNKFKDKGETCTKATVPNSSKINDDSGNIMKFISDLILEINEVIEKVKAEKTLANATPSSTTIMTTDNIIRPTCLALTPTLLEMLSRNLQSQCRLYSLCQTRSLEDRTRTFVALSQNIGITKEGLFKKIKRYRININNDKLIEAKNVLSKAVSEQMAPLLEKYGEMLNESQKLRSEQKEMLRESHHMSGADDDDADEDNDNNSFNSKSDGDKLKKIVAPRKRFLWSPDLRKLLCEVVELRLVHYDMSRIKSQTADEHIKQYLDTDVKSLWPPGWMQTRILYKESKAAHQKWTGEITKPKKILNLSSTPSSSSLATAKQDDPHQPKEVGSTQNEPIIINLDESDDNGAIELTPDKQAPTTTSTTSNTITTSISKESSSFSLLKPDQLPAKQLSQPPPQQVDQQLDQTPPLQRQPQIFQQQQTRQQSPQQTYQPSKGSQLVPPKETFTNLKDKSKPVIEGSKLNNFSIDSLQNSATMTSTTTQMNNSLFNTIYNSSDFSASKNPTVLTKKTLDTFQPQDAKTSMVNAEIANEATKKLSVKQLEIQKNQPQLSQHISDYTMQMQSSDLPSSSKWIPSPIQQAKFIHQPTQQQKQLQQPQQHQKQQNPQHSSHLQHDVKPILSKPQNVQQSIRRNVDTTPIEKIQQPSTNYKPNTSWHAGTTFPHNMQQQKDLTGLTSQQQQMIFQQKYQQYQQQQQEKQQQILSKSPKQERIVNKSSTISSTMPRRVPTTPVDNFPDDLLNLKVIQQQQQQFLSQSAQQRQQQQHVKQQQSIDNLEAVDKVMQQQSKQTQQQTKQHSKSHSVEIQLAGDNSTTMQTSKNHLNLYKSDNKMNMPTVDNKMNYSLQTLGATGSLGLQASSSNLNNNQQQRPLFQQHGQQHQQAYNTQHQNSSYIPHQGK